MSAWWWACQDEGALIRESANDDARPPEHDHPLQLVSPAIAAALKERDTEELRGDLLAAVVQKVSDALGQDSGASWHDLGDKVAAALRERDAWREEAFKCYVNSGADTDGSDARHLNLGEASASVLDLAYDYRQAIRHIPFTPAAPKEKP